MSLLLLLRSRRVGPVPPEEDTRGGWVLLPEFSPGSRRVESLDAEEAHVADAVAEAVVSEPSVETVTTTAGVRVAPTPALVDVRPAESLLVALVDELRVVETSSPRERQRHRPHLLPLLLLLADDD